MMSEFKVGRYKPAIAWHAWKAMMIQMSLLYLARTEDKRDFNMRFSIVLGKFLTPLDRNTCHMQMEVPL